MNNTSHLPTAGVARRLAAMFYDSILLIGVLTIAAALWIPFFHDGSSAHYTDEVIYELNPIYDGIAFQFYLLAVIVLFFSFFWLKSGQTLGMRAWKMRLENKDGSRPTLKQCLVRISIASVSLICAGLGYWWQWIDKDGLNWQDRLSGTRVVKVPKTEQ